MIQVMKSIKTKKNNKHGQAMVEYVLLLAFVAVVSIGILKSMKGFMDNSFGSLATAVTKQLTVGVCEKNCFFSGYYNK